MKIEGTAYSIIHMCSKNKTEKEESTRPRRGPWAHHCALVERGRSGTPRLSEQGNDRGQSDDTGPVFKALRFFHHGCVYRFSSL